MAVEGEDKKERFTFEAGVWDVLVIGAGHAGCEAAVAAARLGMKVMLFTLHLDSLANLPCNPSIGGTAKGQLVREIDALGGVMGKVADASAIQTRMLNRSKGAAVFSPRAQIDRRDYGEKMKALLEREKNLFLRQGEVTEILLREDGKKVGVAGVILRTGAVYRAPVVIVCSGTYMESRIIIGETVTSGGPDGLSFSQGLSSCLSQMGIPMRRFKTGTPARIHADSLDFTVLEKQDGESDMPPFSFENEMNGIGPPKEQIPCHIAWTNHKTKEIIRENLHRSPLFSGVIEGVGPRYCPSIEDKIVKFPDKERHQAFVEPMGKKTRELYLQGMSSSLPEDVQEKVVHSLKGLENAHIQRSAYAIEYDCVDPTSVRATMESKIVEGLFTAGQINGSSGYEEAAGQGLIAGINASRKIQGEEPFMLDRSEAYIGVLIDDLVTKGTDEPYRMMTSRAEYRLFLRQDNADRRLTEKGHEIGLITEERLALYREKNRKIEEEKTRLRKTFLPPSEALGALLADLGSTLPVSGISLAELLKRPQVTYRMLSVVDKERKTLPEDVIRAVEIDLKYEGYILLERNRIDKFKLLERKKIPENIPYAEITGLRIEARQKLASLRPLSVGQASRISGVSPADISVLLVYLETLHREEKEANG